MHAKRATTLVLALAFVVSGMPGRIGAGEDLEEIYRQAEALAEVRHWILENYVVPVRGETLFRGALRGMAESLDPHSTYLTREEVALLQEEASGAIGGIGAVISSRAGQLTVVSVVPGGPAQGAGLAAGDLLLAVDGAPVGDAHVDRGAARLRGKPGSEVGLTVQTPGDAAPRQVVLVRALVEIRSIPMSGLLKADPRVAYLRMQTVQRTTPNELERALTGLIDKGAKAAIIDLRGNPGGLLEAAVAALDLFVGDGKLLTTYGRSADADVVYRATPEAPFREIPLAVIIDRDTASSAEILAGGLKARRGATVVGGPSFGKNSVQTLALLDDGSALKITTARYLIPDSNGGPWSESPFKGISPDIAGPFETPPQPRPFPEPDEDGALAAALSSVAERIR